MYCSKNEYLNGCILTKKVFVQTNVSKILDVFLILKKQVQAVIIILSNLNINKSNLKPLE
jgi:hypothetical protein